MSTEIVSSPPLGAPAATPSRVRLRGTTASRRLWTDRMARWIVALGGIGIIASVLGILLFILIEVVPMFRPARAKIGRTIAVPTSAEAILVDEYQYNVAALGRQGVVRVVRLADGVVIAERDLLAAADADRVPGAPPTTIERVRVPSGARALSAVTADGRLVAQALSWRTDYGETGSRTVVPVLAPPTVVVLDDARRPIGAYAAQIRDAANIAVAAQLADERLVFLKREVTENAFSGEIETAEERFELATPGALSEMALDAEGRNLYAGTAGGTLLWWNLDEGESAAPQRAQAGDSPITAMSFLIGDRSVVVGQASGALSVWFPVRQPNETFLLTRIRDFAPRRDAITLIAASERNRTFLAKDDGDGLGLYFSTSQRTLWQGTRPIAGASAASISPKGDGVFLAGARELGFVAVDNPHPEVSAEALFGKVWFEGYTQPEFVWQSTGGTDDFETKLSLTPLIVGTLKGTLYSLLLAIPLGVLGAMFASQFLHPKILGYVKPTVEIMAALPSVVLGFLAGLWLAPILERLFPALLLAIVLLPLAIWLAGLAWSRLPLELRGRYPVGAEIFLYLVVVAATILLCIQLSPGVERLAFGGNFQNWLLATTGLRYDQRNAVVVGLAMGFAVIPIIFAISEDAFSNVPKNLIAGSLALGANRWQTVTRVVLPTASPGIFSAIMIGFGRAVGETMIVLMATGNTPIMELNAFNGFRTLSANIAVEIPEAPHGGTLYRTLFLAALVLFVMTFVVNTAAELVRQRLRRRYAEL